MTAWRIVPTEPTPTMHAVGAGAGRAWKLMLAAAPTPTEADITDEMMEAVAITLFCEEWGYHRDRWAGSVQKNAFRRRARIAIFAFIAALGGKDAG